MTPIAATKKFVFTIINVKNEGASGGCLLSALSAN